ncbi:MAG: hypothetical protein KAR06_09505, partial [Deltaproteobacteria bacterium]|nr:hypothetical protein [Deltaproteobacteria bacterium]
KCRVCGLEHPIDEMHGHIDGVITDLLGVDRLWEHKAINHFTFERYWKGTWPLDYIVQCCLYTLGLQKVNPAINEAVLLIKNKNTSQYLDMVIRFDSEMDEAHIIEVERSSGEIIVMKETPIITFKDIVGNAVDKFRKIHEHTLVETLPDRPYEVGTDYPCTYCSWQETCWEEYELEYAKLTEDKALEQEWYETCKYYLEVAMHAKNSETELKELKLQVLQTLKGEGAKSGRIGPYIVKIMQRKSAKGISEWVQIRIASKKKGRK